MALALYIDKSKPPKEDFLETMTEDESLKLDEFHSIRNSAASDFCSPLPSKQPSLVLDGFLFLGTHYQACNGKLLEKLQIKHILNVCDIDTHDIIQEKFHAIHIPMADDTTTDIKQYFDQTNELLHGFYQQNERCLVHCAAGISRSATIVLAYLMKYHHNTLKESYTFLREKRPQICPNEGFFIQLLRYESELIRSRDIQPDHGKVTVSEEENPIETLAEFQENHEPEQ